MKIIFKHRNDGCVQMNTPHETVTTDTDGKFLTGDVVGLLISLGIESQFTNEEFDD